MNSPDRERAAFHEARARNYRRQAQGLLERSDPDSAAALLYESAKQCINALANQQGINPGSTAAKERFLKRIAEQNWASPDLIENWRTGIALHIHADRGHLNPSAYNDSWDAAQTFIDEMLLIYARGG